jgi:hypothetical protein
MARGLVRHMTTLDRLRSCGWETVQQGGPALRLSGGRAGFAGVSTCGSVWACPACAEKIQQTRRAELRRVMAEATRRGDTPVLITLTMRHTLGDRLAGLWDDLSNAWETVMRDGSYRRHREGLGLVGWVRAVEVTHGWVYGWHVHAHVLVVLRGRRTQAEAEEFGELLWGPWSRYLTRKPGRAPVRKGFDVRVGRGASERLGEYLAKATYGDDVELVEHYRESYEGLAAEATMSAHKHGKGDNRTPFGVLAEVLASGMTRTADGRRLLAADERDVRVWHEWEKASRGRKQLTWSRKEYSLRAYAELGEEKDDEQVAQEEIGGDDLLVLAPATWRAVRVRSWELLDLAEDGGLGAVVDYLDARGLEWTTGRAAPPRPPRQTRGRSSPRGVDA